MGTASVAARLADESPAQPAPRCHAPLGVRGGSESRRPLAACPWRATPRVAGTGPRILWKDVGGGLATMGLSPHQPPPSPVRGVRRAVARAPRPAKMTEGWLRLFGAGPRAAAAAVACIA